MIQFTSDMLLDAEGGRGERRVMRIARAPLGFDEIVAKLENLYDKRKKLKDCWNSADRLIYMATELGEMSLILLVRINQLMEEESNAEGDEDVS